MTTSAGAAVAPQMQAEGVSEKAPQGQRLAGVLRGLLWSGIAALVAAVAVGVWGDWAALGEAFGRFSWTAVPVALGLTLFNYVLRFGKWHFYVRRIGARPSVRDSALIFVAGFALALTPGKSGELLKAYLLHRRSGAPAWKAAPISLAERATDGLAVLVLAGIGLGVVWGSWVPVAAAAGAALAGCSVLVGVGLIGRAGSAAEGAESGSGSFASLRMTGERLRLTVQQSRLGAKMLARLMEVGEGAAAILDPWSLLVAVGIGVVSWGAETVALWNALGAFGMPLTGELFGRSLVALNAGTLVGAVSLLPGGAGAAEATIAGVLVQGTSKEIAAAATLLIRLCTLWFGAALGIGALVTLRKSLVPGSDTRPAGDEPLPYAGAR